MDLIDKGKLKKRDNILERVGRLKGPFPQGPSFPPRGQRDNDETAQARVSHGIERSTSKPSLAADGAYLLRSNQAGWTAREFWETYIQLTVIERAFRVLKSDLLLRPIWHHYKPGRTSGPM